MKNPWLKFYPADWRADPALRMCSITARGLWMEMLCLMHNADPQGSLVVNGRAVTDKQLASLCGSTLPGVTAAIAELEEAGVFSREPDGTIYSRRIRRDIAKAERDRLNGKGGGNPALKRGVNPQPNGGDKAQKQKPEADAEAEAGKPASAQAREPAAGLPAIEDREFEASCRHAVAGWDPPKGSFKPMLALAGDRDEIVAVLREVATSGRSPVGSWKLWADDIVPERLAARKAPRLAARASPPPAAVDDSPRVNTPSGPRSLAFLRAEHEAGRWSKLYGPAVGQPGCLLPELALEPAE